MILNNRYLLLKILGQGGMGRVYLAVDQKTQQQVAVKECFASHASAKMIRRIKREYYFMHKINHPNVVKGIDFFCVKNNYFIVMEYAEGITLEKLICHYPRSIDFAKQLRIAIQICKAVVALNKNGIIHRDLKPSNIILSKDYTPKILDLGIAKSINAELTTLTKTDGIVGTTSYMSTEQIYGEVKDNTDVFCLGVVLYQFFTWRESSPFYAGSTVATMDKIIHQKLPLLSNNSKNKSLCNLASVLDLALQKDSLLRFPSVEQMLYSLRRVTTSHNPAHTKRIFLWKKWRHYIVVAIITISIFIAGYISHLKKHKEKKTTALMVKAVSLLGREQYEKSIECSEKIIAMGIKTKQVYFQRAICYMNLKKYSQAIHDFNVIVAMGQADTLLYRNLAQVYTNTGEMTKAINAYGEAIKLVPSEWINYHERGILYYDMDKYAEAIQDFTSVIQLSPQSAFADENRADCYVELERYAHAVRDSDKALSIDSSYITGFFTRGNAYYGLEKYEKAIVDFSVVIQNSPTDSNAHNNRGLCYYDLQRYEEAIVDFNKVIELDASDEIGYYNRGNCYYALKKYKRALADYNESIRLAPTDGQSYYNRALLFTATGKYNEAIADFDFILNTFPNDVDTLYEKANTCFMAQRYENAAQCLSKIIAINPKSANAYVNRGNCYYHLQEYVQANRDWQKAIELEPGYEQQLQSLITEVKSKIATKK